MIRELLGFLATLAVAIYALAVALWRPFLLLAAVSGVYFLIENAVGLALYPPAAINAGYGIEPW